MRSSYVLQSLYAAQNAAAVAAARYGTLNTAAAAQLAAVSQAGSVSHQGVQQLHDTCRVCPPTCNYILLLLCVRCQDSSVDSGLGCLTIRL